MWEVDIKYDGVDLDVDEIEQRFALDACASSATEANSNSAATLDTAGADSSSELAVEGVSPLMEMRLHVVLSTPLFAHMRVDDIVGCLMHGMATVRDAISASVQIESDQTEVGSDGVEATGEGGAETHEAAVTAEWTAAAWLKSNGIADVVASALLRDMPPGSTELDYMRELGASLGAPSSTGEASGAAAALLQRRLHQGDLLSALAARLQPQLAALGASAGTPPSASEEELGGKFIDEGVGFELEYGDLKTFFGGLESIVGAPDPKVAEGMQREHCASADSTVLFTTPNYKMTTTSIAEWWFVVDPENSSPMMERARDTFPESFASEDPSTLHGIAQPRSARPLADFAEEMAGVQRKLDALEQPPLSMLELIGARLYTGPLYIKYNTALRGLQSRLAFFQLAFERLCLGNRYTTTLHCINSSVVKLSKLTVAATVYRGVSNGRLPPHFRKRNSFGVRGGIDPAFMSTTLDRRVAGQYVGGFGVVFQIRQGMVDRGADISWLSQYPHEKEILFAPLAGMEVQGMEVDGSILAVDVRLSINLSAATIEQVIGRRRKLIANMGDNMAVEVREALADSGFEDVGAAMLDASIASGALAHPGEWYNEDANFLEAVRSALASRPPALQRSSLMQWMMLNLDDSTLEEYAGAIVSLLESPECSGAARWDLRWAGVRLLGKLTPAAIAKHGEATVQRLLTDEDSDVQSAARDAFEKARAAGLLSEEALPEASSPPQAGLDAGSGMAAVASVHGGATAEPARTREDGAVADGGGVPKVVAASRFFEDGVTPRAIILDVGTANCRVGFAGQLTPLATKPNIVGRPDAARLALGMRASYVGEEAIRKGDLLTLVRPMEHGDVIDWESMEIVLRSLLTDTLGLDGITLKQHPVILLDRPLNPPQTRERYAQMLFEAFGAPALAFMSTADAPINSVGSLSGIIVDIGEGCTTVSVMYGGGYAIPHAMKRFDFGGSDLTHYLASMIAKRHGGQAHDLSANPLPEVTEHLVRRVKEGSIFTARTDSATGDDQAQRGPVRADAGGSAELLAELPRRPAAFEYKGKELLLDERDCGTVVEALFSPSLLGKESEGVHQLIISALLSTDVDIRVELCQNVVLTGGCSAIPGLAERLRNELVAGLPPCYHNILEVITAPQPGSMAFAGASIQATHKRYKTTGKGSAFLTLAEYESSGPQVVQKRF